MALALAGCVGYATYSMGLFNAHIEGLTEAAGSTGSNPLNVVLNVIPSNIVTASAATTLSFPPSSSRWLWA